jgi:hypothetical protein
MKSKPIGVRFDLYKLEIIQKEQNLRSAQQVVNYLMDNYNGNGPKLDANPEKVEIPVKKEKTLPAGLKGVDLLIWKAENLK